MADIMMILLSLRMILMTPLSGALCRTLYGALLPPLVVFWFLINDHQRSVINVFPDWRISTGECVSWSIIKYNNRNNHFIAQSIYHLNNFITSSEYNFRCTKAFNCFLNSLKLPCNHLFVLLEQTFSRLPISFSVVRTLTGGKNIWNQEFLTLFINDCF